MVRIITPARVENPIHKTNMDRKINAIYRAAHAIHGAPDSVWPFHNWNRENAYKIAKQALNSIAAIHAARERGDIDQAIWEAFCLGRFHQEWIEGWKLG